MRTQGVALAGRLTIALVTIAPSAAGQRLQLGVDAIALTSLEGSDAARALGGGIGGFLETSWGPVALDVHVFVAGLDPDSAERTSYDIVQSDLRLRYTVSSLVALELGGGRRSVSPAFAAQEIGLVRVGLYSENHITRNASIWVRGAYLPITAFTGGGHASLSVELGFGVAVETSNHRFRANAQYEFQRIDRAVEGIDVPLQTSLARLGLSVRLF